MRAALLTLLVASSAFAQHVSFSSRAYVLSPVTLVSFDSSKEYGFDSLTIRNDGAQAIVAVHVQMIFRSEAGDEVADERRVQADVDPRDTRRFAVGMGQIEGLKQLARSRGQSSALAILTIESVEFADGSEWKQTERERGAPIDPLKPAKIGK